MNAWALAMIIIVVTFGIVIPTVGLWLFNPHRARSLKIMETASGPAVSRRIALLRIAHPEIVKTDRLDRHPVYITWCLAIVLFGISVQFFELPYSQNGADKLGTQHTLGISLLLGGGFLLIGSLMGAKIGRWRIMSGVHDNVVSSSLGDDIRAPYIFGWWGMVSQAISMGFYQYTVTETVGFHRVLTTYGGIFSVLNIPLAVFMIAIFIGRLRSYATERQLLIHEAIAVMAAEDRHEH